MMSHQLGVPSGTKAVASSNRRRTDTSDVTFFTSCHRAILTCNYLVSTELFMILSIFRKHMYISHCINRSVSNQSHGET